MCQWAIAANEKEGDAYVLLANAYSLLDSHVTASSEEPFIYLRWSASILQHWLDTPLSQYPFTKNIEIGKRLRDNILETLSRLDRQPLEMLVPSIRARTGADLRLALSPETFGKIKQQLEDQPL